MFFSISHIINGIKSNFWRAFFSVCVVLSSNAVFAQWDWAKVKKFTQADGLYEREVTGIAVDKKNTVWLATASGMLIYDGNKFVRAQTLYPRLVRYFTVRMTGMVYAPETDELYYYNDDGIYVVSLNKLGDTAAAVKKIFDGGIGLGFYTPYKTLLFITAENNTSLANILYYVNTTDSRHTINKWDIIRFAWVSLGRDSAGDVFLWVDTDNKHFVCSISSDAIKHKLPVINYIVDSTHYNILEIFAKKNTAGLAKYKKYAYQQILTEKLQLKLDHPDENVWDFYNDNGKALWITTRSNLFMVPAHINTIGTSSFNKSVRSIFYNKKFKRLLYCSTDANTGVFAEYDSAGTHTEPKRISGSEFYYAALQWDDSTWIAVEQSGEPISFVYNANKDTGILVHTPWLKALNYCTKINGQFWGGGDSLFIGNYGNSAFSLVKTISFGAGIFSIATPINNKTLVATANGLFMIDVESYHYRLLIPGFFYSAVHINNNTWAVGSATGGLYIMDTNGNVLQQVSIDEGMPHATIYSITYDEATGIIWCGNKQGLVSYQPVKRLLMVYTTADGLIDNEFNHSANLLKDNVLYMGGLKGINIIPLDKIKPLQNDLFISSFTVTGRETNLTYGAWNLPESLNLTNGSYTLRISLSSINSASKLNYRYRIKGGNYSGQWIFKEIHEPLEIIGLGAGEYTIEFDTEAGTELTHKKPTILKVSVAEVWYRNKWLYVLELLTVIGLLRFAFIWRERQKSKKIAMEKLAMENDLKAIREQINPHFIQNTFDFITRHVHTSTPDKVIKVLHELSNYLQHILETTEHARISIKKELDHVAKYLNTQLLISPGLFTYNIQVAPSVDVYKAKLPAMLIQPIVENSIKHAFAGVRTGGQILITITQQDNIVTIYVKDNGPGINENNISYNTATVKRRSKGIELTKKRMLLSVTGQQEQNVEISFNNRTDGVTGAEFIIRFPVSS